MFAYLNEMYKCYLQLLIVSQSESRPAKNIHMLKGLNDQNIPVEFTNIFQQLGKPVSRKFILLKYLVKSAISQLVGDVLPQDLCSTK